MAKAGLRSRGKRPADQRAEPRQRRLARKNSSAEQKRVSRIYQEAAKQQPQSPGQPAKGE